jgi:hypothetical protein
MPRQHSPYIPATTADILLIAFIITGILLLLLLFIYLLLCFLDRETEILRGDFENSQRQPLLLTARNLRVYQTLLETGSEERRGYESVSEESSESSESSEESEGSEGNNDEEAVRA